MFLKYLEEGLKPSSVSSQILQSNFKAIYCNQTTIESFKLGTMYIFLDKKMDVLSFLQKLEI